MVFPCSFALNMACVPGDCRDSGSACLMTRRRFDWNHQPWGGFNIQQKLVTSIIPLVISIYKSTALSNLWHKRSLISNIIGYINWWHLNIHLVMKHSDQKYTSNCCNIYQCQYVKTGITNWAGYVVRCSTSFNVVLISEMRQRLWSHWFCVCEIS